MLGIISNSTSHFPHSPSQDQTTRFKRRSLRQERDDLWNRENKITMIPPSRNISSHLLQYPSTFDPRVHSLQSTLLNHLLPTLSNQRTFNRHFLIIFNLGGRDEGRTDGTSSIESFRVTPLGLSELRRSRGDVVRGGVSVESRV